MTTARARRKPPTGEEIRREWAASVTDVDRLQMDVALIMGAVWVDVPKDGCLPPGCTHYLQFGVGLGLAEKYADGMVLPFRESIPEYSTDIVEAWKVHQHMCRQLFSVRLAYMDALQDMATAQLSTAAMEDPAYAPRVHANGHEGTVRVAWPDVLMVLADRMPEAICNAALKAAQSSRFQPPPQEATALAG